MSNEQKTSGWARFYTILKTLFLLLIVLQFVPGIISKIKHNFDDSLSTRPQIGYMPINSMLTNARSYLKRLEDFEKDENIKALILQIESPGGYPGTSQVLFSEVLRLKSKKPVVVLVENVCASGGYYIASAASKIVASASAQVGSIGVAMAVPNIKELLDSWKIRNIMIHSGVYKMVGEPRKEIKDEEIVYLQQLSDDIYQQFTKDVAQQRGLALDKHTDWANGKIFTGNQALAHKLIDQVGSYRDAVNVAKELAGIKEEVKVVSFKEPKGIAKLLYGDDDDDNELSTKDKAAEFVACVGSRLINKCGFKTEATGRAEIYL